MGVWSKQTNLLQIQNSDTIYGTHLVVVLHRWIAVICILLLSCEANFAIRISPLIEPESASVRMESLFGSNLTLHCGYILEGNDQLYSVKWHKQLNGTYYEFYSYIASLEETIHYKPQPGIRLDIKQSKPTRESITLLNVNLQTEGIFRCEAVTDESFQVVRKQFQVTVFIPPEVPPTIVTDRRSYGLGERVQLRCITGASRPISKIKWFINNIIVPESYIRSKEVSEVQNSLTQVSKTVKEEKNFGKSHHQSITSSSSSELDFTLKQEHLLESGHFTVKCMSYLNARFFPEVLDTKIYSIDFGVWHTITPVLIGLQKQYRIGEWIELNCTIPDYQKTVKLSGQGSRIEWLINDHPAKPTMVQNYFTFGLIGLKFQLEDQHLGRDSSLSIKCMTVQMWPSNQPRPRQKTVLEDIEQNNPLPTVIHPTSTMQWVENLNETNLSQVTIQSKVITTTTIENSQQEQEFTEGYNISDITWNKTETVQSTALPAETFITSLPTEVWHVNENITDSMLDYIGRLAQSHPQVLTSFKLTLLPIALVSVFFVFV